MPAPSAARSGRCAGRGRDRTAAMRGIRTVCINRRPSGPVASRSRGVDGHGADGRGPGRDGALNPSADVARYFPAPVDCPTFVDDTEWHPLVDGEAYLTELDALLRRAGAGDTVLIAGLEVDPFVDLAGRRRERPGVSAVGTTNSRRWPRPGWTFGCSSPAGWSRHRCRGAGSDRSAGNAAAADHLRELRVPGSAEPPLAGRVLLDFSGALLGSNHQKTVTVAHRRRTHIVRRRHRPRRRPLRRRAARSVTPGRQALGLARHGASGCVARQRDGYGRRSSSAGRRPRRCRAGHYLRTPLQRRRLNPPTECRRRDPRRRRPRCRHPGTCGARVALDIPPQARLAPTVPPQAMAHPAAQRVARGLHDAGDRDQCRAALHLYRGPVPRGGTGRWNTAFELHPSCSQRRCAG